MPDFSGWTKCPHCRSNRIIVIGSFDKFNWLAECLSCLKTFLKSKGA